MAWPRQFGLYSQCNDCWWNVDAYILCTYDNICVTISIIWAIVYCTRICLYIYYVSEVIFDIFYNIHRILQSALMRHDSDVPWALTRFISLTAWLVVQKHIHTNNQEIIKVLNYWLVVPWIHWFLVDSPHHDDVIKWKHFPRYWPFVWGIHRSRWIPRTKASDAELWCFLWSAPE